MITAGVFFAAFVLVTIFVSLGVFHRENLRATHFVQRHGGDAQDLAFALFSYLGSIEVTLAIAALLGLALFRGLRLLAVLPFAFVLVGSGLELLVKLVVPSVAPAKTLQRWPDILPRISHSVGSYSFPSGHVLRATVAYGLLLYLADRWELFGRDSSRLSPVLVLVIFLMGWAVVYLGWHWFTDALGGFLLGLTLLFALIAYLERKRTVNPGHQLD